MDQVSRTLLRRYWICILIIVAIAAAALVVAHGAFGRLKDVERITAQEAAIANQVGATLVQAYFVASLPTDERKQWASSFRRKVKRLEHTQAGFCEGAIFGELGRAELCQGPAGLRAYLDRFLEYAGKFGALPLAGMNADSLELLRLELLARTQLDPGFEALNNAAKARVVVLASLMRASLWTTAATLALALVIVTMAVINPIARRLGNSFRDLSGALERAERADRAKSEFLANMSHEIRTPMNGVMGMAELLAKSGLTGKQLTFCDVIVRSGNALVRIINDILDFSKLDAGQVELCNEPFSLRDAIEDVATLMAPNAEAKGIDFAVRVDPRLPATMIGDAGRIRQVVTNLVGNAIKFTETGHVLVDVSGVSPGREARIRVAVEDTGIGIPANRHTSIFEKFRQVDGSSTRRHEGTGLGLAISRLIVEQMGGAVGLMSELGQGSTFWFTVTLPAMGAAAGDPVSSARGEVGARILLVDHNALGAASLCELLAAGGFVPSHATDAKAAEPLLVAATAAGTPFELVLLDIAAPRAEVERFLQRLSTDAAHADIPVIGLAPIGKFGGAETAAESDRLQAVITRPVRASQLIEMVGAAVRRRRARGTRLQAIPPSPLQPEDKMGQDCHSKILVAEDNEVNRIVISHILQSANLEYEVVNDGRQAVDYYRAHHPRLVLMDVSMPEKNGLDATREIRAHEAEAGLPPATIIGVTAHALKGDEEMCLEAGMDDYVAKPISPDVLIGKLRGSQSDAGAKSAA